MRPVYPDLRGKSAYVTGGASGIGAAIVLALAEQGAQVHFIDLDESAASTLLKKRNNQDGARVTFELGDASNADALQKSVRTFADASGLDILVNNVANDMRSALKDITADSWRASLAVNLDPAFFASQAAAPFMTGGSIINMGSINALFGPENLMAYNTAKAGLLGLTRSLATELGPKNIRVNAILPGWVATEKQLALWLTPEAEKDWKKQTRLQGRISADDIANAVLFLASDASRMMTAQPLVIDAGWL